MYILKHWFLLEKTSHIKKVDLCVFIGNYMLTYTETTIINKNKLLIVLKLQTYQNDKYIIMVSKANFYISIQI